VELKAKAGEKVRLVGKAKDPDSDALAVKWWQYHEADTYAGRASVADPYKLATWFTVPADAPVGSTIHLILEVSDDGAPSLTSYQRVVVTVSE
jgi:hypothetical protein